MRLVLALGSRQYSREHHRGLLHGGGCTTSRDTMQPASVVEQIAGVPLSKLKEKPFAPALPSSPSCGGVAVLGQERFKKQPEEDESVAHDDSIHLSSPTSSSNLSAASHGSPASPTKENLLLANATDAAPLNKVPMTVDQMVVTNKSEVMSCTETSSFGSACCPDILLS